MSKFPMPLKEYESLSTKERLKRIDEALDYLIMALYPIKIAGGKLLEIDTKELNEFLQRRWC